LKRSKPDRQELISLIKDLLNKYPPSIIPSNNDNTVKAYKEVINEFSELLLFISFSRIYLPNKTAEQIADEILYPEKHNKKRRRERGFSSSNKILLDAESIISCPHKLFRKYKCKIDEVEFQSLMIIAHRLRESGKSIDDYFTKHQHAKNVRKLIAHGLYVIYEMGIMFREELYQAYEVRTKTIKKMPETEAYYKDAQKLKVAIKGRQTIKNTISKDAEEYRRYLISGPRGIKRDRHFYEDKRFRYMTILIAKINDYFKKDVTVRKNTPASLRTIRKNISPFSIDGYINAGINKPRPIHSVMLLTLPALSCNAKASQT